MAKDFVAIVDYGSGNLRSAAKAFERVIEPAGLNLDVKLTDKAEDVLNAARIVLPGQGAFGDCMRGLTALEGMREALEESVIKGGKPFLGICVGMQLMANRGLEHGGHDGLGWIPGEVVPITPPDPGFKIPHMGWNTLSAKDIENDASPHFVLRSADSSAHYYFVHSFMFECKDSHHMLAETDYGGPVTAIVGRDNMIGMQFHPEKSQQDGLNLIEDFLRWNP